MDDTMKMWKNVFFDICNCIGWGIDIIVETIDIWGSVTLQFNVEDKFIELCWTNILFQCPQVFNILVVWYMWWYNYIRIRIFSFMY